MAIHPDETPIEHIRNVLQVLVAPAEKEVSERGTLLTFRGEDVEAICARLMEAIAKLGGLAPQRL